MIVALCAHSYISFDSCHCISDFARGDVHPPMYCEAGMRPVTSHVAQQRGEQSMQLVCAMTSARAAGGVFPVLVLLLLLNR